MYCYNSINISLNILCNSLQIFLRFQVIIFLKFIDKINFYKILFWEKCYRILLSNYNQLINWICKWSGFVRGFRVWDLPDGTQYRVENEKFSLWAGIESNMIPVYGNSYVYK